MTPDLQQGIYYLPGSTPGNSFAVVFLRATEIYEAAKIRQTLSNLWQMYSKLQKGFVPDLDVKTKNPYHGNLSILIGYGPKIFEIKGIRKTKPSYLTDQWLFRQPMNGGGGGVLEDVGLKYADDIISNDVVNDHVIIQFIGDSQMVTHRAVVETWKALRKVETNSLGAPMTMRSFYTGFNRPDNRSWLGFHDGVSNISSSDRTAAILIDKKDLDAIDYWTTGGTYIAFLRIIIDLSIWDNVAVKQQERIVGRDKATGCPIIDIDEHDNNVQAKGCPTKGTYEITDDGNEQFRNYSVDNFQKKMSSNYDTELEKSHIGRIHKTYDKSNKNYVFGRIFRQGYEFLESTEKYPYFRLGLNFVSFQGGSDRIFRILKYGLGGANFGGDSVNPVHGINKLLSVRGAGLFLVPPFQRGEEFPGEIIFTENPNMSGYKKTSSIRYR
jgi:Dyp-type peroxidase family